MCAGGKVIAFGDHTTLPLPCRLLESSVPFSCLRMDPHERLGLAFLENTRGIIPISWKGEEGRQRKRELFLSSKSGKSSSGGTENSGSSLCWVAARAKYPSPQSLPPPLLLWPTLGRELIQNSLGSQQAVGFPDGDWPMDQYWSICSSFHLHQDLLGLTLLLECGTWVHERSSHECVCGKGRTNLLCHTSMPG